VAAPERRFDLATMVAEAQHTTGCDDMGEDDILLPLEILLTALEEEARLTSEGRERAWIHISNLLAARLRLFNDRKVYREVPHQEICNPIFMTGPQRSGTSFLYSLLACDPRFLAPVHWQIWSPSPPPNHPGFDHNAQISRGYQLVDSVGWLEPYLREKHDYHAMNVAESTLIHELSFISGSFPFFWDVPSYGKYFAKADTAAAYRIEKKVLQALQYGTTNISWLIKSPLHLSQLESLFEVFPDTRMVVNHRDPVRIMSSIMSMLIAHRRQFGNRPVVQERAFGLGLMESIAGGLEDMMRRREDPVTDRRFADVLYVELERRPVAQVEKVYDRFGMVLENSARERMQRYVAENRRGKFGVHQHVLEGTGLRLGEIRERFKSYTDHFDIPLEEAA
jgi:hypothetical protein